MNEKRKEREIKRYTIVSVTVVSEWRMFHGIFHWKGARSCYSIFFYIILNSFKKQERIPKDAALWYKEVIKINEVIKTNGECLNIHDDRRV